MTDSTHPEQLSIEVRLQPSGQALLRLLSVISRKGAIIEEMRYERASGGGALHFEHVEVELRTRRGRAATVVRALEREVLVLSVRQADVRHQAVPRQTLP